VSRDPIRPVIDDQIRDPIGERFSLGPVAPAAAVDQLLLETGDFLLLESGDTILLE